jgi:preprotein translocase subunit YajC
MNWNTFGALLAMGPQPTAPGTQANPKGEMFKLVGMMLIMGFVMYFIMIRPQRQRQKQLDALLKSVKPGDKVVTGSGIVGVVITVKERTVTLRSGETKLEVLKSTVSEITEKSGDSSSSEPSKT